MIRETSITREVRHHRSKGNAMLTSSIQPNVLQPSALSLKVSKALLLSTIPTDVFKANHLWFYTKLQAVVFLDRLT